MSDTETNVLVPQQSRCTIRVLIVADGRIHFKMGSPIAGFSLSEVIEKALRTGIRPREDFKIITARRHNDKKNSDPDNCADIPNFTFNEELFGTDKYDQVWMFGDADEDESDDQEPPLTENELKVISKFMNAGGGVFATGDHASLGYAMCGNIPRVRSMRKWCFHKCEAEDLKAPGVQDTRIDSLREGLDPGFERSDQSDTIPQEIRPKFFLEPSERAAHPHPLLIDRKSAITVLPDHAHEGECVIPTDLSKMVRLEGYVFAEYPTFGEEQIPFPPQAVAISTSAGGLIADELNAFPTEPRSYYPIVAYDGHQVLFEGKPIGRVVVDSSFHHFLDINLRGTHSGSVKKVGFYDINDNPTPDYQAFKEYYRNIVRYLCSPSLRSTYYRLMLVDLRLQSPLIRALAPIPNPSYQDCLAAGALAETELTQTYSRAEALQCALVLMPKLPEMLSRPLASLIDPWLPAPLAVSLRAQNPNPTDQRSTRFDFDVMVRLFLGAAILRIVSDLSLEPLEVGEAITALEQSSESIRNPEETGSTGASEVTHAVSELM